MFVLIKKVTVFLLHKFFRFHCEESYTWFPWSSHSSSLTFNLLLYSENHLINVTCADNSISSFFVPKSFSINLNNYITCSSWRKNFNSRQWVNLFYCLSNQVGLGLISSSTTVFNIHCETLWFVCCYVLSLLHGIWL